VKPFAARSGIASALIQMIPELTSADVVECRLGTTAGQPKKKERSSFLNRSQPEP
jgi:hypothetical protein